MPRGVRRFMTVERPLAGRDLTVPCLSTICDFNQKDAALLSNAETGLEWMKQLHSQLAQFNLFDKHAMLRG